MHSYYQNMCASISIHSDSKIYNFLNYFSDYCWMTITSVLEFIKFWKLMDFFSFTHLFFKYIYSTVNILCTHHIENSSERKTTWTLAKLSHKIRWHELSEVCADCQNDVATLNALSSNDNIGLIEDSIVSLCMNIF